MDDSRSAPVQVPRVNTNSGPDPLIGRVVNDRYKIVGVIARGGMGKVYRAEQSPLGRLVALKVLNPNYSGENDPEFHKRFFLEASTASKLTHPNTVTIFDYGKTDDDVYYIAMELLEGRTLHRALREEGALGPERAMHIAKQVCRSLREAHGLGVIHRDLKPANVYLVQHGDENDFVKVLDFGLVKNIEEKGEELTQAGLFMGSPKYMSPEQIRGEKVDSRVDVYSLGVIMFEMLTGKVPYDRPNSVNILMAHIQEDVPNMAEMNPNVRVPAPYEEVVRRCMAKYPQERCASMDEVLNAIKAASEQVAGSEASRPTFVEVGAGPGFAVAATPVVSTSLGATPAHAAPAMSGSMPVPPARRARTQPLPVKARPRQQNSRLMPLLIALAAAVLIFEIWLLLARHQAATTVQAIPAPAAAPATPQPLRTVLVSLRSTPPGAMVAIGARTYGPTPTQVELSGPDAEPGREVSFRFLREGYRARTVVRRIDGDALTVEAPPLDPEVGESASDDL